MNLLELSQTIRQLHNYGVTLRVWLYHGAQTLLVFLLNFLHIADVGRYVSDLCAIV